jgi:hypothetical protein
LKEANEKVVYNEKEIEKLQPILIEKSIENEKITKEVLQQKKQADKDNEVIEKERIEINEKTKVAEQYQKEADEKLQGVLPALEEAKEAVSQLTNSDINLVKALNNPVAPVRLTMECVLILLGEKSTDWSAAKRVMNDVNFKKRITTDFNVSQLNNQLISKIKKVVRDGNLNEKSVFNASGAAGSLFRWTIKMIDYFEAEKVVKPLQEESEKANELLRSHQEKLQVKEDELKEKKQLLNQLEQKLTKNNNEKKELEEQKQLSETIEKPAGRTFFLKGKINDDMVEVLPGQSSAMLSAFSDTDCFILLNQDKTNWSKGDNVKVLKIQQ